MNTLLIPKKSKDEWNICKEKLINLEQIKVVQVSNQ